VGQVLAHGGHGLVESTLEPLVEHDLLLDTAGQDHQAVRGPHAGGLFNQSALRGDLSWCDGQTRLAVGFCSTGMTTRPSRTR
jgi:hypothetical protein